MAKSTSHLSTKVPSLLQRSQIRILHVDDEISFLEVAKQILELQEPFSVEIASSTTEAVEKMNSEAFDVLVADYQMPQENGLQFLRKLRENGHTIPYIIFSARASSQVVVEAINSGADSYFSKIGNPEKVYAELGRGIRQAAERKRLGDALETSEERYRLLIKTLSDVVETFNQSDKCSRIAIKATADSKT